MSRTRPGLRAYVSSIRMREVVLLQGSPLLGVAFALRELTIGRIASVAVLTLASSLLVTHVFSFNDWADIALDSKDPNKANDIFVTRGISREGMLVLSLGLLGVSLFLFALLGRQTLLLGSAYSVLGALYSLGAKGTPVVSSLPHLAGGLVHFLLGYTVFGEIDRRGILIGLFFALTFAAGHLNQEVRDHDGDRPNGVRTNAVAFGKNTAFAAGFLLFTLAYADLFFLATSGIVPAPLGRLAIILYPLHVYWSVKTLRAGLSFASISRFQNRYRTLYALIGTAMLAALFVG